MKKIHFTITTPDGTLYKDEIDQVRLTTSNGQITVLPGHTSLITDIMPGEVVIIKENTEIPFALFGGFIEVRPGNKIIVLADAGQRPETIDLEAAEAARERAQKALAEKFDPTDYEDAALALERELARIRVARKYRAKGYRTSHQ